MTDDLIEMTSMEKIYMADKGIREITYVGEELLKGIKVAQANMEQVCYADILQMRRCYLAQKREMEKARFLLNILERDRGTEFQQARVKSLHKRLLNLKTVQEQISFLLDSLEEEALEKEADKEVIKLAKTTIEKVIEEPREAEYERQLWKSSKLATAKETRVDNRIMCLHCPKCKKPMACIIYIDGDLIQDMEYTAEMMAEYIRGFAMETWIIASPLEMDEDKGQRAALSYVMRAWPQKNKPEKMLSTVFSQMVLREIAERHCDSES